MPEYFGSKYTFSTQYDHLVKRMSFVSYVTAVLCICKMNIEVGIT
jgi:hypothetical protein